MKTTRLLALDTVPGFKTACVQANIRDWPSPRHDLAVLAADAPVPTAGVFTQNQVAAAPVKIDKKHLKASGGIARAIIVNAGIANASTGTVGRDNALACIHLAADRLQDHAKHILVASTGVIGRQLPMEKMEPGILNALDALGASKPGDFARAIMTTDLKPKEAGLILESLDGAIMAGACKGSGMIAPNMATMLAFIATDAAVQPKALKAALKVAASVSFNRVTIDGDTSTNDSLFIMASGANGASEIDKASGKRFDRFVDGLCEVSTSLARQIAADGEGATKLVIVKVTGAGKRRDAEAAARTVAESPLVKTAMFGNDPNWGRIAAAAGRSNAKVDENKLSIHLCGKRMYKNGLPVDFEASELSCLMKAKEIELHIDLGLGDAEAKIMTCDFSYDYVKINADYTT